MIICVYLNPTIDKTVYVDHFMLGGTNRPVKVVINGAGKAINAAVVLKELGQDVKVMGVLYRADGAIIKNRLEAGSIFYDFIEMDDGESRTNTKIFDGKSETITEINESGRVIAADVLHNAAQRIYETVKQGDTVVLTGSLPRECPPDFYAKMIQQLNKKDARCVLDADGEVLRLGIEQKPYFIKPNIDELATITDSKLQSSEDIISACKSIIKSGIDIVAVSMGGEGALICNEECAYFARPLRVDVLSTVGAGDSMVAGIVANIDHSLDMALRAGVAAATASITLEGTNLCTKEMFADFYPRVSVEQI